MASETDILAPRAFIVPKVITPLGHSGAHAINPTTIQSGALVISGAKLYFNSGTAWELITSTAS